MFKDIKKIFLFKNLFEKELTKKFYSLLALNVIFSFLEILNFVLLFPFFKLIFSAEKINSNFVLQSIDKYGFNNIVIFYALLFLLFSIFRNIISLNILKKNKLFFVDFNSNITSELINKTINIPFPSFVKYNYTEFPRLIYNDINYFIIKGLTSFFLLINEIFLIFFILIYLFSINLYFVLFLVFFLFFTLFIINRTQSKDLKELVFEREQYLKLSLSELNEFYLANKEIRFLGLQFFAIPNLVNYLSKTFTNYENIKLFEKKPRIILESFIYVFIVMVTLIAFFYFNIETSTFSLIILGFLRMTPSASKINSLYNSLKASFPILEKLLYFKNDIEQLSSFHGDEYNFKAIESFELKNYSVLHDDFVIFKEIDLIVKKGDVISIYGKSGSGKTSLFDSFFGYCIKSKNSQILINNTYNVEYLNSNFVSYFPQNIYLLNKTLLFNLTLEEDETKIDFIFLDYLISLFLLTDVVKKLDNGIYSICGFGGYSFSGGEKQRIGMVRSFYNKKEIIILDEFTSALDSNTESQIIDNLKIFLKNLNAIIFIVSHNNNPHKLSNKSINLIKND